MRLHELLRHPDHTLLLWARNEGDCAAAHVVARDVAERTGGRVRSHVIVAAAAATPDISGITLRDVEGHTANAHGLNIDIDDDPNGDGPIPAYLIRPDGYVSYRTSAIDPDCLAEHLSRTIVTTGPG